MYSFMNDYSETAHPAVMQAILKLEMEQNIGYGLDSHCEKATQRIKELIGRTDVTVHFMPGGTITNKTMISHALRPYEAVVAAESGHINVHETGAIEATGHKVISVPSNDGKLTVAQIREVLAEHTDEHMVLPKMVYLSHPTEIGTVYTEEELREIAAFCRSQKLYLYLDGARLAMALAVKESGLTLGKIAGYVDAFYIGGTKVGALFGEALVIRTDSLKENVRYAMKQTGSMMAKGWLLGVQFEALLAENRYEEIGQHANNMAALLKEAFLREGFPLYSDSCTNQIFVILPNELLQKLDQKYITLHWKPADETHTVVRFCTSFATKEEEILRFLEEVAYFIKE